MNFPSYPFTLPTGPCHGHYSPMTNEMLNGQILRTEMLGHLGQQFMNAYPVHAANTMSTRLQAAKMALHSPDRVERLANGRGWRLKLTDAQLDLVRLMGQYDPKRPPIGHDRPEWV